MPEKLGPEEREEEFRVTLLEMMADIKNISSVALAWETNDTIRIFFVGGMMKEAMLVRWLEMQQQLNFEKIIDKGETT